MSVYTAAFDCPLYARQPPGREQRTTNLRVTHNRVELEQGLVLGSGGFAKVTELPKPFHCVCSRQFAHAAPEILHASLLALAPPYVR